MEPTITRMSSIKTSSMNTVATNDFRACIEETRSVENKRKTREMEGNLGVDGFGDDKNGSAQAMKEADRSQS
jgi:hypothetical protein